MPSNCRIGDVVLCSILVASCAATAAAQQTHVIQVGGSAGNRFSPSSLTIQAGDTVQWQNAGGSHNVDSDESSPEQFTNGGQSSAMWTFSRQFQNAGTFGYHCDPHRSVGMTGTVIVQGGTASSGTLAFSQGSFNVQESAGTGSLTVRRTGGSSGAVSVQYATSNGSATAGADYTASSGTLNWGNGDSANKFVAVPVNDDSNPESVETVNVTLSNVTGGASLGLNVATLRILDNDSTQTNAGSLTFDAASYSVSESAGTQTITVERQGGSDGAVSVDYSAEGGSADDGVDFESTNGSLDWADGDSADKAFDVTILEDNEEETSETVGLLLSNPTGGADLGPNGSATLSITDNDLDLGPCVENETTLCLRENDRFRIRMHYTFPDGREGEARTIDIGLQDSGIFYFLNRNNAEVLIKVLNACTPNLNNRYWVFYAATTTVEFELTVEDTVAGQTKVYRNPQGMRAESITDVGAFATCP